MTNNFDLASVDQSEIDRRLEPLKRQLEPDDHETHVRLAQEMEAQRLEDATYVPVDFGFALPPNGETMRVERPAREYRTHVLTADAGHLELPADVVVHHCSRPADQFENKTVFLTPGGACPSCGYQTDPDGLTVQPDPREPEFMREYPCEPIEEPSASITKRKIDERPVPPICDCGGAAAGTPHAMWCSTRRRD